MSISAASRVGTLGFLAPINGMRLTLTSGTPITTSDVATSTSVYLTPYTSASISIYYNGQWQIFSGVSEVTFALGTLTSGKNYDLFAYYTGAAVALELSSAWSSDTARTDALTRQDGVLVKSSDHSRLYIGTFRTISTTQTTDTAAQRFLWNQYNQVDRKLLITDNTSSWAYTSASWRQARATSSNKVEYVTGDASTLADVFVHAHESAGNSTGNMSVGVGVDSTTVNSADVYGSTGNTQFGCPTYAKYAGAPGLGYHALNWLEWGDTGGTFYGNVNSLGSAIAGMVGYVKANPSGLGSGSATSVNTSASGGWVTALDFDFTAQSNQTLSSDTNYTIGGLTWTKTNTANEASAMTVTNGSGLIIQPASSSDYDSGTRTAPMLGITLANAGVPAPYLGMMIRVWWYIAAENLNSTNGTAQCVASVDTGSMAQAYTAKKYAPFNTGTSKAFVTATTINSTTTQTASDSGTTTDNVLVTEFRIGFPSVAFYTGAWSSGWPAPTIGTLRMRDCVNLSGAQVTHNSGTSLFSAILAACRASSTNALSVTYGRLRIDYRP